MMTDDDKTVLAQLVAYHKNKEIAFEYSSLFTLFDEKLQNDFVELGKKIW